MWTQDTSLKEVVKVTPSIFSVAIEFKNAEVTEAISLNIAFSSLGSAPIHLSLNEPEKQQVLLIALFGKNHGYVQ